VAVSSRAGAPVTLTEMQKRIDGLRSAVPAASRAALLIVGGNSTRLLKDGYLSGNRLGVRSGRLRGSVGMEVVQDGAGVSLEVFAGRAAEVNYARIQEHGGTIRPTRGKFLAIPVGPARTGAGVTKGGWESPRTAPVKLRFQSIRGGSMGLLVIDGKRKSTVAYVLVRSVRIKPKHYMRDTQTAAVAAFPEVFGDQLARRLA